MGRAARFGSLGATARGERWFAGAGLCLRLIRGAAMSLKNIKPGTWLLARRIAGLWMVVLAIGLALIGVVLAIYQARSFTLSLMAQTQAQTEHLAEQANRDFEQQLRRGLLQLARHVRGGPDRIWDAGESFPAWFDGLYAWDGEQISIIDPPVAEAEALLAWITERLPALRPLQENGPRRVELAYADMRSCPLVVAWRTTTTRDRKTYVLAARIQTDRLRELVMEPLIDGYDGLELVAAGSDHQPWSQPLYGALRAWAIRPTDAFVQEQRSAVLGQTFAHLGITTLALATVLVAMWVLTRVVRHEAALAEMKANFVADVSHELKTPLSLIRMFGETLQSGRVQSEEKRQEYYDIITRESTRLTGLIDNILDFSRINAGRQVYQLRPTDLAVVVRDTFEAYQAQLEQNGFEHHLTIEPDLPEVLADRNAIAQVLINFINNAIKYSAEERHLVIEVTQDTRRGDRGVLISVHDRGIGIRPEDRAQVLDGFFRAPDGRVREQRGAGLGLALVKHIVDGHGGSLDVESRLVKGSTFRIFLPAVKPA